MVDVAVAYALDNGSVGAHVDSSASIHLMVEGKKQVRIGKRYNPDEIPDDDLLLLKEQLSNELEPSYEFLLEPGDILYLPECYAHEFTAVDGDAISYIASFQSAPTWRAINHFANFSKERGKSLGAFYQDSNSINHENPAEVKKDFIDEVKSSFMGLINDDSLLNEWFGSFVTQQDVNHDLTERQSGAYQLLKKKKLALVKAGKLQVNSYLRFAPIKVAFSTVGDGYRLFAGGSYIDLPPESLTLCKKLAAAETVNLDDLGGSRKLLQFLLQNKAVA
jgi:50S ribosomal protein L16 3-hydroxylase